MPSAFLDTNILVYAAREVFPLPQKTVVARALLRQPDLCFSVQVLSEFTINARSPHKLHFNAEQERDWMRRCEESGPPVPFDIESVIESRW